MLTALIVNRQDYLSRVFREPRIPLTRITLFCGANGSGKSTALQAFCELVLPPVKSTIWTHETAPALVEGHADAVMFFSMERDNPRTANSRYVAGEDYATVLLSRWISHGQSNYDRLVAMFNHPAIQVLVLDEPETALDLDGLLWLRQAMLRTSKQVIAATHSPFLLSLANTQDGSVQVFGGEAGYFQRVMRTYQDALEGLSLPEPAARVRYEQDGGRTSTGRRT